MADFLEDNPAAVFDVAGPKPPGGEILFLEGVSKSFGTTRAVRDADFVVREAEVVGLMGGNGAGKSTLMRIVGGLIAADSGDIRFFGKRQGHDHSPAHAMRMGIRFVHQELSLCPNLTILENFAIELSDIVKGLNWRSIAAARARAALADIFPGTEIDPRRKVANLSLSQQQMVEIARAASHPATKLLILDEPTSSLGSREAEQLRDYVKRRRSEGMSFVFISHRLRETLDLADRITVMRNGSVAWTGAAKSIGQEQLLGFLGSKRLSDGAAEGIHGRRGEEVLVRVANLRTTMLGGVSLAVRRGEVVGLAGLEGSGQRELLREIYSARKGGTPGIAVAGKAAFVSGDRAQEGIFPLWSINDNIALSAMDRVARWGFVSLERMRDITSAWFNRLDVRAASGEMLITSLSGGNQQKVTLARALAAGADVLLLDDPTRGVDLETKAELYRLFRSFAGEGKSVLWYSTDDAEFVECDRTIVMRDGVGTGELERHQLSSERLAAASFMGTEAQDEERPRRIDGADLWRRFEASVPTLIPVLTFATIFLVCVWQNENILSPLGLTLVFSAGFSLAFAAMSQLFMIAAGDIDLGIGPFIGLVNAIGATWLISDPVLAAGCFVLLLLAYPLMGLFIQIRGVPAIIVTLGMSFVWLGLASQRLPRAGGSAPDWLVGLIKSDLPLLPMPVFLCIIPALMSYLVLMVWRYGAVLRGFGASPRAIAAAGWSTRAAKATLYGFAGLFAFLAGVITASTRGGDPTGATSITLLSVAAVILGGASFAGGVVAPIGALFGVLTLVLVGTLLSLLGVNGVYLPMVQGLLLLGVVGVRILLVRKAA